jgi:5-(carboxyamino)imidazole ribonucleotide mutase
MMPGDSGCTRIDQNAPTRQCNPVTHRSTQTSAFIRISTHFAPSSDERKFHRLHPIDARRVDGHAADMDAAPVVGIIMGSTSDWPTLEHAARTLRDFGVAWEAEVVSAHRTPGKLVTYSQSASARGLKCIIAGAGGAAHLPGMTAAMTELPVLGVPVQSKTLNGVDSLLSIVQMPAGIPTATFAIGKAGAINAALFAVAMLATENPALAEKLRAFRQNQTDTVTAAELPPLD